MNAHASSPCLQTALDCAARGWRVFPAPPGEKKSFKSAAYSGGRNWGATTDADEIRRDFTRWSKANLGIATGPESGIFVLDLDQKNGVDGVAWLADMIEAKGEWPDTVEAQSPSGSWHVYFAYPAAFDVKTCEGEIAPGVDVRGHGGMVIAPPSAKPGAEKLYRWKNPPGPFEVADAPQWVLDLLPRRVEAKSKARTNYNSADLGRVQALLAESENGLGRDDWVRLAGALKHVFGDAIREAFLEFSYRWPDTEPGDPEKVFDTFKPNGRAGLGTVFYLLGGGAGGADVDLTEDGVALSFTARFGGRLRFDHDAGRWFEWRGDRWAADNTHLAYSYCREAARELSENADNKGKATARKAAFAGGVERMARADRAHAVTHEAWDQDPLLLGCPGVTVDLRDGTRRTPDPADGITKQTAVAPANRTAPLWLAFLEEATESDPEMIRFLQQWCGYCLSGDTREHALLFVYGPGGNGKSVFLETVAHILGDYAATASMDAFTASKSDRHPTDLAMLRGARLVTASETEEGRAWAESRIKQVTGGDRISARFMRQDFFTYTPQFKLTVVGNHKPVLKNVDDAARRRFNIVPFTVKPANPDRQLTEKLKGEAGGILSWMIQGCLDWQANGLVRPRRVLEATAEYFDDQDLFGQWLDECCRVEPENRHLAATPKELFEAWSNYAHAAGETPGTQTALGNALIKRGLTKDRRTIDGKRERIWRGIELHKPEAGAWQGR